MIENIKINYTGIQIKVITLNTWWEGLTNVDYYSKYDYEKNQIICEKKVPNEKCKNKNCLTKMTKFICCLIEQEKYDIMSFQECTLYLIENIKKHFNLNQVIDMTTKQKSFITYCYDHTKYKIKIYNGLEIYQINKYFLIIYKNGVTTIMTVIKSKFGSFDLDNCIKVQNDCFIDDNFFIKGNVITDGRPFLIIFIKKMNLCHINLHAPHHNKLILQQTLLNNGEINGLLKNINEIKEIFNENTKFIINGDFNYDVDKIVFLLNYKLYSEKILKTIKSCCNTEIKKRKKYSYDHILSNLYFLKIYDDRLFDVDISDHKPISCILCFE